MEKSVILIDAENFLMGWRAYCKGLGWVERIDYEKLIQELSQGTNLLRAYFYDGVSDSIFVKKKNFLEALQRKGIQLRTKVLKSRSYTCAHCNRENTRLVQKGVDVSLATDILRHAWQETCEICIIISGDEDYKDAIDVAKDKGVKIWIVSFKDRLSKELGNSADRLIFLEDIFHKVKQGIEKLK